MQHRHPKTLKGIGIGRSSAIGPVIHAREVSLTEGQHRGNDHHSIDDAIAHLTDACQHVAHVLMVRSSRVKDETMSDVLSALASIANDAEYLAAATRYLEQGNSAVTAIEQATQEFVALFSNAGGYLAERATDLYAVRDRIIAQYLDQPEPGIPLLDSEAIIVARSLSPADIALLDLSMVKAIVLEQGGQTDHTAIVAAQLGIPCVIQVNGANELRQDGHVIGVDAAQGLVICAPDEQFSEMVVKRQRRLAELSDCHGPGLTQDGHSIELLANIGTVADAAQLTQDNIEGVGLMRTEVLFLNRTTAPTITEQTEAYSNTLTALPTRKVVVRTLDAGADKPLAFITQGVEDNPALGARGFRLMRSSPELLETQLSALDAAGQSSPGQLWVMAPMIATVEEAQSFAAMAKRTGIAKVGVMIEVPSAALNIEHILAAVDFVSLGTNDLAQYTMAADRLLGGLADLLSPWQPALIELEDKVLRTAVQAHKPAGICGESAADPLKALVLAGMGATSLSMAPNALSAVRFALKHHTISECRLMAEDALNAKTEQEAKAAALSRMSRSVAEALFIS